MLCPTGPGDVLLIPLQTRSIMPCCPLPAQHSTARVRGRMLQTPFRSYTAILTWPACFEERGSKLGRGKGRAH